MTPSRPWNGKKHGGSRSSPTVVSIVSTAPDRVLLSIVHGVSRPMEPETVTSVTSAGGCTPMYTTSHRSTSHGG